MQLLNISPLGSPGDRQRNLTILIAYTISFIGLLAMIIDAISNWAVFPNVITIGPLIVIFSGILAIIFWEYDYLNTSKLIVSIFPIPALISHQILSNSLINEYYFWFPYAIIAGSLVPSVVYSYNREKRYYISSLVFYFIFLIFIDELLIVYATENITILPIVNQNRIFYKAIPILIFIFVNLAIIYLKLVNAEIEKDLKKTNNELESSLSKLESSYKELERKREIIENRNIQIAELNRILNKRISIASDELTKKDQTISKYAFSNSHEIRGPVATILGLLNLMELKSLSTSEKENLIISIRKSTNELDNKIRELNQRLGQG